MGVFRFSPGCACCQVDCTVLLGPFCDCCGLLAAGAVRVWNAAGFDRTFPVTGGFASVTVPGANTFHVQLTSPYPTRTLSDITVAATGIGCTMTPSVVQAYAPPDRPATLTLTTPDGTGMILVACGDATSSCTAGQHVTYSGATTITLTHGCWCGTAGSVSIPVVFFWSFGPPCLLRVWVPVCWGPVFAGTVPDTTILQICGFSVATPPACVDPASLVIPTPPPLGTNPCHWTDLATWDTSILTQPTTCWPLYWRSGFIPPFSNPHGTCQADSACSFLWPGGGYLTLTA